MSNILVSGLINVETTLQVDDFPLPYFPVRYPFFGINGSVSGVGYNIAKALTTLGHQVKLLSLIGEDAPAQVVRQELARSGVNDENVISAMPSTCQAVIIYDETGRRQIHTDLKDIQERPYPSHQFEQALTGSDLAVLANINFSRPFLAKVQQAGIPIATDVHAIADLDDEYNQDFMAAADILFMSHERLQEPPEVWLQRVQARFGTAVIVIGLGQDGALLAVKDAGLRRHIPAVFTRPVVNTIGAGDALFSSFLHGYLETADPVFALKQAVVFASYKIGAVGAADGFLTANKLHKLTRSLNDKPV